MSNHPISLLSSFQITQATMARSAEALTPPSSGTASTGATTSAATVPTAGNAVATDVHVLQSSDATSFVYGSTANNKPGTAKDYTTVDDAAKLANRVAADNDVLGRIKREDRKKKNSKEKKEEETSARAKKKEEEISEEPLEENNYYLKNTMMVASHGLV